MLAQMQAERQMSQQQNQQIMALTSGLVQTLQKKNQLQFKELFI